MSGTSTVTGVVVGTGSAINVDKVGFRPTRVEMHNISDAVKAVWQDTMPDAAMEKTVAGTDSYVTSDGITPRAAGFTLGADSDLNASGEEVHFTCFK